jgi:UDPglucose 6-dehydrogenase
MNDFKKAFSNKIVQTLYNTVADKKKYFLRDGLSKDTNDTRESATIYVADDLINEHTNCGI